MNVSDGANLQNFDISADLKDRVGVYANMCVSRTVEDEVILDFVLLDDITKEEDSSLTKHGTLVSRVVVTKKTANDIAETIKHHLVTSI